MLGRRIPLFKLLGFQVWIDWSWFLLALLITWSLATGLFPALYAKAGLSTTAYWMMGLAGMLGLFVSIILHELGHSVVARRFGMRMRGITLFVFGGVAEMLDEPPSARAEFWMAIAGPAVSVVIAAVMLTVATLGARMGWPAPVFGVAGWLGWINLVLVAFNVIPAFPLDGGRVLRALLWHLWGDLRAATRVTATIGSVFAMLLMGFGVLGLFTGNFIAGFWWIVLGLFLRGAAAGSYQQMMVRRALEGESVAQFMSAAPISVPSTLTVRQLVDDYFYRYYHKTYPVVDHGELTGCITAAHVKAVPAEQWSSLTVGEIAEPCTDANTIRSDADAMAAMTRLNRSGASRLLVVDDGRLVGIVSLKDLMQLLSLKVELEGER